MDNEVQPDPNIDFDEIQLFEVLGRGKFGFVRRAKWSNQIVAVKEIEKDASFEVEVQQLSCVDHPNIIRLLGMSKKGKLNYLILEYADGGSLFDLIHKDQVEYSLKDALRWAYQCAEGVAYLHGKQPEPIIHRDLKPHNLLLTNNRHDLKICDFGFARFKAAEMSKYKGTPHWMAPEVFIGSQYTEKCDVFSWTIIFWEILSRQIPYDNGHWSNDDIMFAKIEGERPPIMENWPKEIENLITSGWAQNPEERPSISSIRDKLHDMCISPPECRYVNNKFEM